MSVRLGGSVAIVSMAMAMAMAAGCDAEGPADETDDEASIELANGAGGGKSDDTGKVLTLGKRTFERSFIVCDHPQGCDAIVTLEGPDRLRGIMAELRPEGQPAGEDQRPVTEYTVIHAARTDPGRFVLDLANPHPYEVRVTLTAAWGPPGFACQLEEPSGETCDPTGPCSRGTCREGACIVQVAGYGDACS